MVDDICKKNPEKTRDATKIVYFATYYGREYGLCDVYDTVTGEVWEVKRYGGGRTCSPDAAKRQLENYVNNGYLKANPSMKKAVGGTYSFIPANIFTIRDKTDEGTYIIAYWDAGVYDGVDGVIYYDYLYIKDVDLNRSNASNLLGMMALGGISYLLSYVAKTDAPGLGRPRPA